MHLFHTGMRLRIFAWPKPYSGVSSIFIFLVRFRSRQIQHKDLGYDILNRFTSGCAEYGSCDKPPVEEGRNLSLLIVPLKPDQKKGKAEPKQANNNHKEESENGKDQNA